MHELEILSPGGSLEGLKACVNAGADAIYMGGMRFGARAYAQNPDEGGLFEAIEYCHLHGAKLYLTVNTLLRESELEKELYAYLESVYRHGLDAVLVQDLGVLSFIRKEFPALPVHASTQMSISSIDGARMMYELGCERIVPAREISLKEVKEIHDALPQLEIECFVHGALCYSYSGQCLMSSMIGGRSGNRGRCAQPCRQPYALYEQNQLISNHGNAYLLSLKDTCTIDILPQMIEAGISSFKIEGRMKRPEYAAGVTSIYREYVDRYCSMTAGAKTDIQQMWHAKEKDRKYLMDLYNRGGFSQGYYSGEKGLFMMSMHRPNHAGTQGAKVHMKGKECILTALEDLYQGDVLELENQGGSNSSSVTIKEDIKNGKTLRLKTGMRLKEGQILPRTRCEKQLADIRSRYMQEELQVKIKEKFTMHLGQPAILEVQTLEEGRIIPCTVSVTGAVSESARKSEVTENDLRRQLSKTGGSGFVFDELVIEKDEKLFLPMSAVNEIRRDALVQLKEKILNVHVRDIDSKYEYAPQNDSSYAAARAAVVTASAETAQQVYALAGVDGIDAVYVDACMFLAMERKEKNSGREEFYRQIKALHGAGKKCYLMLPSVWRSDVIRWFEDCFDETVFAGADGYVLRNQQQLWYMKEKNGSEKDIIADSCIYTWNKRAAAMLRCYGVKRAVLPDELNLQQLKERGCEETEMTVYGRTILMTTAQCLWKNTTGCMKTPALRYLQDKMKASFPVRCKCGMCSNVIYNSLPLDLLGQVKDLHALQAAAYRLQFTIENEAQTVAIASYAVRCLSPQAADVRDDQAGKEFLKNTTRGHFKRGVE